jgi:hypothetical protein
LFPLSLPPIPSLTLSRALSLTTPRILSLRSLRAILALGMAALLPGLCACAHDYAVENRLTPVHVWLSAPELARTGGSVDALIYVGSSKVVEGNVRFDPGVSTVIFPIVHVNAGDRLVQVVLAGGTIHVSQSVEIEEETWINVTLSGGTAKIAEDDEQPRIPR